MNAVPKRKQTPMNQAIQVARRQLGLDEETYRDFLRRLTGLTSTKDMNAKQLYHVLSELKKDGFTVGRPGDASQDQDEQAKKARFLWLCLKNYGELRDPSEKALLAYVKRITRVQRMEWLKQKQMTLVIETLKKWGDRVEKRLIAEALASGKLPPQSTEFRNFGDFLQQISIWRLRQSAYLESFFPDLHDDSGRPYYRAGATLQSALEEMRAEETRASQAGTTAKPLTPIQAEEAHASQAGTTAEPLTTEGR